MRATKETREIILSVLDCFELFCYNSFVIVSFLRRLLEFERPDALQLQCNAIQTQKRYRINFLLVLELEKGIFCDVFQLQPIASRVL